MKKDFQLLLFANIIILASYGFLAFTYYPFHDDLGTLVWPFREHGFSYLSNKNWAFFRPIEYYLFALGEKLSFSGLLIIINFAILSITSVFATKLSLPSKTGIVSSSPIEFLVCGYFVLTPIIAASSFNIDTLSQCLANLCIVFLLWDITTKKEHSILSFLVLAAGFLSKESFYPFALLYCLIKIARHPSRPASYVYLAVPILGFALRSNIISPRALEGVERYQMTVGLNIIKNTFLHLAGLFYAGSSPDLFTLNIARELLAILISITMLLVTLLALFRVQWNKRFLLMALFCILSLFPGVFLQGVSEHNASTFAWLGSILILSVCLEAFKWKHVAILLLLFTLSSAVADFRKASLLATTMSDYKTMVSEYRTSGRVKCRRNFERPFSFYYLNSETHLVYILPSQSGGRPLTCSRDNQ